MSIPVQGGSPQVMRGHGPAEAPSFSDGIGDRVVSTDATTGELLQVLRINPALTAVPSFEFALRERVARLANFRHPSFARVRRVDRAPSQAVALALVSDHVEGTRLSEILRVVEARALHLDINAALHLVRQIVPAIAQLHENARDAAHGLLGPERVVVTPNGRAVIVEHVFGSAVEQMQYGRERLWFEFGVAMPPSAGIPRFDQRADVIGLGVIALSLVLGRRLRSDEFPRALGELVNAARERSPHGDEQPLSPHLRSWLTRALQLDPRRAFVAAPEALAALEEATGEHSPYVSAPVALETFLSRYVSSANVPAMPPLAPSVQPPPPVCWIEPGSEPVGTPVTTAPAPEDLTPLDPHAQEDKSSSEAGSSAMPAPVVLPPMAGRGGRRRTFWAASALFVLASGGFAGFKVLAGDPPPAMASLSVQSNPTGVPVFVDGIERGVTPARIAVAPGAHILELRRGVPRVIPITLNAGADVSQYLEFVESPIPTDMIVNVRPEPTVAAQAVATPPAVPGAPLGGWITARLPFPAEIRQDGRLLGTTEADRLMIAAGTHQLEFANDTLGFRAVRTVQVAAGKVTSVSIDIPKGTLNLNAAPWAEVWVDGQRVGETPIGNLSVPIGAHEIVFKHPQFGERRHAVSVTATGPVRLSVEMK